MPAQHPSIGSRLEPPAPARVLYIGGPRDGREEVPGGVPTIVAVEEAVGFYSRDVLLPDSRWRMVWRAFEGSVSPSEWPSLT